MTFLTRGALYYTLCFSPSEHIFISEISRK